MHTLPRNIVVKHIATILKNNFNNLFLSEVVGAAISSDVLREGSELLLGSGAINLQSTNRSLRLLAVWCFYVRKTPLVSKARYLNKNMLTITNHIIPFVSSCASHRFLFLHYRNLIAPYFSLPEFCD